MEKLHKWRMALEKPTLDEAARLLDISAAQMQRLEKGLRKVGPESLSKFEDVTGIPRHELRPDIFGEVAA